MLHFLPALADVIDPGTYGPAAVSGGTKGIIALVCIAIIAAVLFFVRKL